MNGYVYITEHLLRNKIQFARFSLPEIAFTNA